MTNLGIWPNFREVRGDARPWLVARWKAHGRLSIQTFFAIYYSSGAMRQNVYKLGYFRRGSTSLQSNFTWTGWSPINHSWHQKTRDTVATQWCIPSFWRNTGVWRTDGQRWTDGYAVAYTALAKLAWRHAVKNQEIYRG